MFGLPKLCSEDEISSAMIPAISKACRYAEEQDSLHALEIHDADHDRGYDNDDGGVRCCRSQQMEIRFPDSRLIGVGLFAYEAAEW